MITASAPGKLMLLGEHAVVYGYPCLVTAIDMRLSVSVEVVDTQEVQLTTSGNGNNSFITEAIAYASSQWKLPKGLSITTHSTFSGKYGFGSSSAVTVATLYALSAIASVTLSKKELFDHAFRVVLAVQGVGSGFDVASACYGHTIFYENKGEKIEELSHKPYELVVGYSGVKADTVQIIKEVAQKKEMYPEKITKLFGAISTLVSQAKEKMIEGDFESVGKYMNYNHEYLRDLGVSSEKLENLVFAAKKAGAWGAKISGAGGGDCMIALVSNENADNVRHAITQSGGELVNIGVNADGVRLETTDDQTEQFVVVDSHDTFKEFRSRYDCHHNKQLIHRGVGLLIFDDKKRVLLQKRSKTKDTRPEYWSTSVGGHVQKDESYESAALREAKEELGIAVPISFHSKQVNAYENETEMNAVFTATYNGPFQVNTEEVEEVRFFDRNELERLMKEKTFLLSEAARNDLSAVGYI